MRFSVLMTDALTSKARPAAADQRAARSEFAGGGLLALGFLTPFCAVFLGGDMLVAIFTNRLKSVQGDSFFTWLDNFLYLPEVLYALILGWLLIAGPGKLSLDALLFRGESEAD